MSDLDRDNLQRVVDHATPQQLAAMVQIYWRVRNDEPETSYQCWLDHARPQWEEKRYSFGTVFIAYYNMLMGIESDGHCHT